MDKYLGWIKNLIRDERDWQLPTHTKLIARLHRVPFFVKFPYDQPREDDGYDLRWRFIWDNDYPVNYNVNVINIPDGQCSVLEMMTALSLRANENFSVDVSRTFWGMVKNIGVLGETDNMYDDENVIHRIDILNNRMYEPNGHGGLFMVQGLEEDMRKISIWDQLCRWVNKNS